MFKLFSLFLCHVYMPSFLCSLSLHRLAPVFSLFLPFYLLIPRISVTQVLGHIHITNKSLVYIVGLQVRCVLLVQYLYVYLFCFVCIVPLPKQLWGYLLTLEALFHQKVWGSLGSKNLFQELKGSCGPFSTEASSPGVVVQIESAAAILFKYFLSDTFYCMLCV